MTLFQSIYSEAYGEPAMEREPYQPEIYRYFTTNLVTDEVIAEIPMTDVSFSRKVSAPGELSGTIPGVDAIPGLDAYWGTMPGRTGLYVVRYDKVVWGGIIWDREYSISEKTISVRAETWESYLFRRHIWHSFEAHGLQESEYADPASYDQFQIVRNLIVRCNNDFQYSYTEDDRVTPLPVEADLRLRAEDAVSGVEVEDLIFHGSELKTFGDAITELGNRENGFEWNFTYMYIQPTDAFPNGRFNRLIRFRNTPPHLLPVGAPRVPNTEEYKPGIDTYVFEHPGNIIEATITEDASQACTRQFVVGGHSLDSDFKPRGYWNNPNYIAAGWPLLENIEASRHSDEPRVARLDKLAQVYGRMAGPPMREFSISVNGDMDPVLGSYSLGDWCRVVIDDEFVRQSLKQLADTSNKKFANGYIKRIMGWSVTVPGGPMEPEVVKLDLMDEYDPEATE